MGISLDIHAHPELNYQERYAAAILSDNLESRGFEVERGVGGVETAFQGTVQGGGGDGPTVALLAEYDALPDIGHGCGTTSSPSRTWVQHWGPWQQWTPCQVS